VGLLKVLATDRENRREGAQERGSVGERERGEGEGGWGWGGGKRERDSTQERKCMYVTKVELNSSTMV